MTCMRLTKRQYAKHAVWTKIKRRTSHWDWYYKAAKLNVGFLAWHRTWVWFISKGQENNMVVGPVEGYVEAQIREK